MQAEAPARDEKRITDLVKLWPVDRRASFLLIQPDIAGEGAR
jgi:hypothetical protein